MNYLIISTALLIADWNQSSAITNHADYNETNVVINRIGVNNYFALAVAANVGIGYTFPKRHRKTFWGAVAFTEATYVAGNYSIGVKIRI